MDKDTSKPVVIALGGNAISKGSNETISEQFARARTSLLPLVDLATAGYKIAITHGNGPQVGNQLLRVELSQDKVIPMPLFLCGAMTQGEIGYIIVNSLDNLLREHDVKRRVSAIVTQVVVDRKDPAFENPTKYIGRFYTEEEANHLAKTAGWTVREDSGRGWRRVVPSPWPSDIVEVETVRQLLDDGNLVVTVGGGGIPVTKDDRGRLNGVDAVIDKDRASALLALELKAETLVILTGVEKVSTNFNTVYQRDWDVMSVGAVKDFLDAGQFPAGSMGPKIESAIYFIENGGKQVIITSIDRVKDALEYDAGTCILP
ncbi:MAG: carbamate kinase [bacterium]